MATVAELTAALDSLEASTAANTSAEDSIIAVLTEVNRLYHEAVSGGGTPQQIVDRVVALNTQMQARTQTLTDAALAGTPAAP